MSVERKNYNNGTLKVAIYNRCNKSMDKTEIDKQLADNMDSIEPYKDKIDYVNIYSDIGYSGTNFNRPAFKKLIHDIENDKVDLLIVKDFSRIGRGINTFKIIEDIILKHHVKLFASNCDLENDLKNDINILNDSIKKYISKQSLKRKVRSKDKSR